MPFYGDLVDNNSNQVTMKFQSLLSLEQKLHLLMLQVQHISFLQVAQRLMLKRKLNG